MNAPQWALGVPPRSPSDDGLLFQVPGVLLADALGFQPYRDPSAGEKHLVQGPGPLARWPHPMTQ